MSYNILIVDDSHVIRSMIARTINLAGVPVGEMLYAQDGEAALKLLSDNWIDLVLADINMPVMDGVAMIEKMHSDAVMSSVPVIVISTEGSEKKIEKLWNSGVKAFVKKPFMPETIRGVICDVLGGWQSEGEDAPDESSF
jgi:two-component system, chemotaxis family, chemotaxis protein CheY